MTLTAPCNYGSLSSEGCSSLLPCLTASALNLPKVHAPHSSHSDPLKMWVMPCHCSAQCPVMAPLSLGLKGRILIGLSMILPPSPNTWPRHLLFTLSFRSKSEDLLTIPTYSVACSWSQAFELPVPSTQTSAETSYLFKPFSIILNVTF